MKTRYSFGGDEHVFVEIDEEMSLDACFRALSTIPPGTGGNRVSWSKMSVTGLSAH